MHSVTSAATLIVLPSTTNAGALPELALAVAASPEVAAYEVSSVASWLTMSWHMASTPFLHKTDQNATN